ncbi:ThuA domain-containing protein [Alienimonas chondri]|uniref:ThuA-like domain-containing protein n=1 Tax=Alienimonas chondri TaxID=2681879 RepID=A0ABX1VEL4_9PLAN|nr:ThuA domain-containing protein [Alienimonas chondri]NNJ25866.1 hypothetical protein [Alienimonas chondri]
MSDPLRVTVWNEFRHERERDDVKAVYPDGIHAELARGLAAPDLTIRTATLDEPEHGLTEDVLESTDVLTWWGHMAHGEVSDAIVSRVQNRVLAGMGLVVLHSGHEAKIFQRLMGTTCSLLWREAGEREILWNLAPHHPVTAGIGDCIELPEAEMYGERFDIPEPETLLFVSNFQGGNVFRSGAIWTRGNGRIVYFRPGHETYPMYRNAQILRVVGNAVRWTAPRAPLSLPASKNDNPRIAIPGYEQPEEYRTEA